MLVVQNVDYSVGSASILKHVSIEAKTGELVALCGPNGAGKSTLLRIISGEIQPDKGSVEVCERPLDMWNPKDLAKTRAKLSQESNLTFSFRVWEVVDMGRFPHEPNASNVDVVAACLERVGITELAERYYTSLSGGEKQRVHLARVLAQLTTTDSQSKLLLLDEPTSALDLLHQEVALELVHALCRERDFAVVVVLHDLNLAAAWADRVILLKEGAVRHAGAPAEVFTQDILRHVYGVDALVLPHPVTSRPIITIDRTSFDR